MQFVQIVLPVRKYENSSLLYKGSGDDHLPQIAILENKLAFFTAGKLKLLALDLSLALADMAQSS